MDKQEHRYDNPLSLTNKELGEALTDPAFDAKRDFGEKVYNDLVAEAGRRLKVNYPDDGPTGKSRGIPEISRRPGAYFVAIEKTADGSEWWQEFESKEERDKFIMERRIWTHYDHAKQKHPYFCDRLIPGAADTAEQLFRLRLNYHHEAQANMLSASTVLDCEIAEVYDAIEKGDKEEAIEECYDAIAVLLRLIDVLSDDQPLGKPAPETSGDEGKPTPRILCQSCGKETLLKEGDDRSFCPCCHSSRVHFTDAPLPPPTSSAAPFAELAKVIAKAYHENRKRRHESVLEKFREMVKSGWEFQNTDSFEYPPIDPDYGTMRCCCPFRKGAADAH